MPTRREALKTMAFSLAAPSLAGACPPRENPVNTRLRSMVEQLRTYPEVTQILSYIDPKATKALVHWEWAHMNSWLPSKYLPFVEQSQRELMAAIARAAEDKRVAVQSVLTEGMVTGNEKKYIDGFHADTRRQIEKQMIRPDPNSVALLYPSSTEVDAKMNDITMLQTPVSTGINQYDADGQLVDARACNISAAAYCGAPYMLHHTRGMKLVAMEDPDIDAKAERAQLGSDRDEFTRWIHTERDKYFLKVATMQPDDVSHFVCGYGHDLRDDAAANNVSLAVIQTGATKAFREAREES